MLSGCMSLFIGGRQQRSKEEGTHSDKRSSATMEETLHSLFSSLCDCDFYIHFYVLGAILAAVVRKAGSLVD